MGKIMFGREMMYNSFGWNFLAKCFFSDQGMFKGTSTKVPQYKGRNFFIGTELSIPMSTNKPIRFPFNQTLAFDIFFGYRSKSSTSALAQSFFNHIILQIKRLISRLMRAVAIKPLLPLLSALVFRNKKAASRISFYNTLMRKNCQVGAL
jgi:hypothetical protein